jgi:hypothetical protein
MDFDKIPKPTYDELVDLVGKEKAEECIKERNYNFRAISNLIIFLKIMYSLGFTKGKLISWPYLTITIQIVITVAIAAFIFFMLRTFNFI